MEQAPAIITGRTILHERQNDFIARHMRKAAKIDRIAETPGACGKTLVAADTRKDGVIHLNRFG